MDLDEEHLDAFWSFVDERQRIWHRRHVENQDWPWTEDETLREERFTNAYRILDPGTRYAVNQILARDEPRCDRLLNLVLYRTIGRKETHAEIGFLSADTYDKQHVMETIRAISERGDSPYTGAYMVAGYHWMGGADKAENIALLFETHAANAKQLLAALDETQTPKAAYQALKARKGLGRFLAYQVLVDLLYELPSGEAFLPHSPDAWAKAGPGAKKGIRLLTGEKRNDELAVMKHLHSTQRESLPDDFPYLDGEPLTLADIQNCLCEYHKYEKIRAGTGRGRRKYTPP